MPRRVGLAAGLIFIVALPCGAQSNPVHAGRAPPMRANELALQFPLGVALGPEGAIYVSERRGHRVLRLDLDQREVTVVAGTGQQGYSGDGGPATRAQLRCPDGVAVDPAGNVYVADRCNERIRRVDARTGIITTIAGTGVRGAGADGPAIASALMGVFYINMAGEHELVLTDTDAHRIRVVDLRTGQIRTIAGAGVGGFSGDGGPALRAEMRRPHVAIRARNGDWIIGDSFNQRVRRVDRNGVIRTIAGNGVEGTAPDGTPALEAPLRYFGQFIEEDNGDLLFTDLSGRIMRLVAADGRLRVVKDLGVGMLGGLVVDAEERMIVAAIQQGTLLRFDPRRNTVETLIGLSR